MGRPAGTVIAVAAAAFLLALPWLGAFPLVDPDEAFYPATAAEGLDRGAPLDLSFNGQPRWDKPILSYALVEGSFAVLGRGEAAARLPSALCGAALVALAGLAAARVAGPRAGVLAAGVLGTTLFHQFFSRAAHPEMPLVLGIVGAELAAGLWFALPADGRPRGLPLLAGLAMGWGTLAKGPVALVLPALALATTLALAGGTVPGAWRRALRPAAVALGVALAVAVPWYAAMAARHGPEFLRVAILEQNVERFAIDRYRHPGSVLFFVPYLLGGLLPWTGFLPGALSVLRRGDPAPRERFRLFLAVAAGTALVFYSLSASKLANYALVVFPPLAILLALRIDDFLGGDGGRAAFRVAGGVLLAAATALAVAGAVLLSPDAPGEAAEHVARDYPLDAAGLATARAGVYAVAALLGAGGAAAILVGDPRARAAALATAGAGTLLLLLGSAAPLDGDARPWKRFAEEVRREGGPGDAVAVYRRRLPSVTFYLGRPVEWPATAEELAEFLRGPGPRWLILSEEHLPLLRDLPSTDLRDEGAGYRLLRKPGG